jgi:hypothetical protein
MFRPGGCGGANLFSPFKKRLILPFWQTKTWVR